MKKLNKLNNKGFMIAELLVVTVAIMVIFTIVYSNFYPTMGEYEKRETYNNINSLYANFYVKTSFLKTLKTNVSAETTLLNNVRNQGFVSLVSNGNCTTTLNITNCENLIDKLGITDMIMTTYNIKNLKSKNIANLNEYIDYLPDYDVAATDNNYNLYRLIVKTNDGYATSTFYSKICEPQVYTPWSELSLNTCDTSKSNLCETENIYIKLGDWTTMTCDTTNSLCETTTLYKASNDWTINACDTNNNNCESVNGYLVQTRTQTGTEVCGQQLCSAQQLGNRYFQCTNEENTTAFTTISECESECGSCYSIICLIGAPGCVRGDESCTGDYTWDETLGRCQKCDPPPTCPTYSDWNEGTYNPECIESELTKCTAATLYRINDATWETLCPVGFNCETTPGYRTNEICDNPLENCCVEGENCEERSGFRSRILTTNNLDLNSPFVSPCN